MDKKQAGSMRWVIVGFFTLFMAIMTFNLIVFPACAADTMEQYGIDQSGLTTLSSVTSVVGLFAGLIFGPMLDRMGSRKTIMIFLAIGVVLFYVRAFVDSYGLVVVLTFLASFFVGVCQVAAAKVLDTWFTKEHVSVAYSFQAGGAGIGSACAFIVGGALGLHNSLLFIAVAYTLLLALWVAVGKDGPVVSAEIPAQPPKGGTAMVYKSPVVWLLAIACSCAVGSTLLINTYCINAFIAKGLSPESASAMGTVINLSLFIGGYLGTFLMSVIKRYNIITFICFAGGAAGYMLSWFTPLGANTWIFMVLGGLIIGGGIGMCAGRIPLVPLTGQIPQEYVGTAAGALETIKGVLTFIFPIAIAKAFPTNFNAIFITFGIICVIGIITGAVLTPELGPKGKLQQEALAEEKAAG